MIVKEAIQIHGAATVRYAAEQFLNRGDGDLLRALDLPVVDRPTTVLILRATQKQKLSADDVADQMKSLLQNLA